MASRSERRRGVRRSAPRRQEPATPRAARSLRPSPTSWLPAALLVLGILVVYAPIFGADFTNWDDVDHVLKNPRVTAADGLVRSLTDSSTPGFYPVTYATWFVEWRLGGGTPWLFHVDNVLLHAVNAVLAAVVLCELGAAPTWAWLAAALWALHPLNVGTVAWVAERKNVLYVFWWLGALLLYLRATPVEERLRPAPYLASLALFVLAVFSKGAAMSLCLVLPLVEWTRGRALRRQLAHLIPFVAVGVGAGLALVAGTPATVVPPSLAVRIPLAARAVWFYVGKFLWPADLLPVYPLWPTNAVGSVELAALVALGVVTAGVAILWRRVPRLLWLGVGIFAVNVGLVVGVVWFTYLRYAWVSDHLAYLPSLGLAIALAAVARQVGRAAGAERAALWVLAVVTLGLAAASMAQTRIWRDSETLWTAALAGNPACFVCHADLGAVFEARGDDASAERHFVVALAIEPDAPTAMNLGNVRTRAGRLEDAARLFEQAIELDPKEFNAPYNLGNTLRALGRPAEAITAYRQALSLAPDSPAAHHNLGLVLLETGRVAEARAEFEETLRLDATETPAAINLGRLLAQHDTPDHAVAHYERVLRVPSRDPQRTLLREEFALLLDHLGRHEEAARVRTGAPAEGPPR